MDQNTDTTIDGEITKKMHSTFASSLDNKDCVKTEEKDLLQLYRFVRNQCHAKTLKSMWGTFLCENVLLYLLSYKHFLLLSKCIFTKKLIRH